MKDTKVNRRQVLLASGAALTVGLAGCLGDDDDNGDDDGNGEVDLEDFLDGANGYDGSFEDLTGEDEVEVTVGPGGDLEFDPVAIEIDEGTTVTWVWDSDGHSVTEDGGEFDSGTLSAGEEFEYTFDSAGDYPYVCVPHEAQGHLGGVRVV